MEAIVAQPGVSLFMAAPETSPPAVKPAHHRLDEGDEALQYGAVLT